MSHPEPELRRVPWWRRKWVTIGEVVGVAALAVAVLGYLDSHRERRQEQAEKAAAASREVRREALVLTAEPADDGGRLLLRPMRAGQAVQSQRYLFPHAVLDHAMQVDAAQPQIQLAWVRDGLRRELEAAARASNAKVVGSGRLPVGVVTTYIEDGETRTDRSLYGVGYKAAPGGLFGGPHLVLQGIELLQRGAGADLQARADARWAQASKLD